MKKIVFGLAAFALAVSAATHRVTLYSPTVVNGQELAAGEYQLALDGGKAVLKKGKKSVEANVRVESVEDKYIGTTVRYVTDGGKNKMHEIRLGGTKTRVVFEQPTGGRSAE